MLTIYAVFFDMEDDVPDVYCLDKNVAEVLTCEMPFADYILLEVSEEDYLSLLRGRNG